jgi:hypothetical protein
VSELNYVRSNGSALLLIKYGWFVLNGPASLSNQGREEGKVDGKRSVK